MMRRNILTAIIPALLVTGVANATEVYDKDDSKVDVYGRAVGPHYFSKHNGENAHTTNGDQTYACLGFKEETQISDQLTDYGQWEYQFSGNNSEDGSDAQNGNRIRLAFAGLKFGGAGPFDYGRNYGIVYNALGRTDMLPESGGSTTASDQLFFQRNNGLVTYRSANFPDPVEGLSFAIQYLGRNKRDDVRHSSSDGVGGSISYEFDGFDIVGACDAADCTDAQQNPALRGHDGKAEQWTTGVKHDANNIYLMTSYSEIRNTTRISNGYANETEDVLLVAQYRFSFGLRPSLAYTKPKGRDIEGTGDVDLADCFEVGAIYYFNKSMSTYVDYIINQIDSGNKLGVGSDDTVAAGTVYQF